ncbi:MAG: D-arabinono-1,4-lactone oxidase [Patescibacteria group bacterium]
MSLGGKPYLSYQLYFTDDQLHKAYPNIQRFFALKRKYDPNLLFMNRFYEKYSK